MEPIEPVDRQDYSDPEQEPRREPALYDKERHREAQEYNAEVQMVDYAYVGCDLVIRRESIEPKDEHDSQQETRSDSEKVVNDGVRGRVFGRPSGHWCWSHRREYLGLKTLN